jgi:hypothetical protein
METPEIKEIKKYLSENLYIRIDEDFPAFTNSKRVKVSLFLEDKEISSDSFNIYE